MLLYRNVFSILIYAIFSILAGCSFKAELLQIAAPSLKIENKIPFVIVNSANQNAKPLSGSCISTDEVTVELDGVALGSTPCSDSRWELIADFSAIPDGEDLKLLVLQGSSNRDEAKVLKDTVAPQISGLADIVVPVSSAVMAWSCIDPEDTCQFRWWETASPAHVFLVESFSSSASALMNAPGLRYLFVEARDRAGNTSSPTRTLAYIGEPRIFIADIRKENTFSGVVNLNIFAPPHLVEMSLFNNATCVGAPTWVSTAGNVNGWNLDSGALGGVAHVGVKFRMAGGTETSCYTDSITWVDAPTFAMCTDTSINSAFGRLVDSGGISGNYLADEYCYTQLALAGSTRFTFESFDTVLNEDYVDIEDGDNYISESGLNPIRPFVVSPTTDMWVYFYSDWANQASGFSLVWEPAPTGPQTLTLNGGATLTVTPSVTAGFAVDNIFSEVYLTENPGCSGGGAWTSLAASLPWTFSNTSDGTKTLFAKFRDSYGNESFCQSDDIQIAAPTIDITYPNLGDILNNELELEGNCYPKDALVEVSGSVSGSVVCDKYNSWAFSFDISSLPNNSPVNVVASVKMNGVSYASATASWNVVRNIVIDDPVDGSLIGPDATLSGSCDIENAIIETLVPVASTTCQSGSWSLNLTLPGNDGDPVQITVRMRIESVVQAIATANLTLSTAAPIAVINGAPSGTSIDSIVTASVGGSAVGSYRFKFGSGIDCSDSSGYSTERNVSLPLSLNQGSLPDGSVTVCVVGRSSLNSLWQSFVNATSATWNIESQRTIKLVATSATADEGTTGLQISVLMSDVKPYDVRVFYNYYGNAKYMIDHSLPVGFFTIPAGQTSASISYDLFDNALADGDRDLRIFLTHTDTVAANIADDYVRMTLIKDNETAYLTILKAATVGGSGGVGCAIWSDSRLRCWGRNIDGLLGTGDKLEVYGLYEPDPGASYIDVSGGHYSFCAVTSANVLKCWGSNSYGQLGTGNTTTMLTPTPIDVATSYVQVAVGSAGACGRTSAGRIKCWGYNVGPSPVFKDADVYTHVSFGSGRGCGITTTNELRCWVEGGAPTVVEPGVSYSMAKPGGPGNSTCAITTSGILKCWSGGGPLAVDAGITYKDVGHTSDGTCGVTSSDDLKCWGKIRGTVSNKIYTDSASPMLVPGGNKFASLALSTGGYGGCAVSLSGELYCMGDGYNSGYRVSQANLLEDISPDSTVEKMSVGSHSACALRSDGKVLCLGGGYADAVPERQTPVIVRQGASFAGGNVFMTEGGGCIIDGTGQMSCAGIGSFGANGTGITSSAPRPFTPVASSASFAITTRENYRCAAAIDTAGKLYAWGNDGCAGVTVDVPVPVDTAITYKPFLISGSGDAHFCALTLSDDLRCWGYDGGRGHLAGGGELPSVMDVGTKYKTASVGYNSICGITYADKLRCWGHGVGGRLGTGSTSNSSTPTTVDGAEDYLHISLGMNAVCGITTGGVLKCWGRSGDFSTYTDTLTPTVVNAGTTYKEVVANYFDIVALTTTGEIHYWPQSYFAQAPVIPLPAKTFLSISSFSAAQMFCAKATDNHMYCQKKRWAADDPVVPTPMSFTRLPQ